MVIALFLSVSCYAVTNVNGSFYVPATVATTITTTDATDVFTSDNLLDPASWTNKLFMITNVATSASFIVYMSTDEATWFEVDSTTFSGMNSASAEFLSLNDYPIEYMKVTGALDIGGIATPEVIFRGSSN
jgi:hypothetical protein